MDHYPTLKEMGINRPHEIAHYSMHMDDKNRDVLHIYYNREKGSLLAASRRYEFGRSAKALHGETPDMEAREVFEISPFLLKAVAELDEIIGARENQHDQISALNAKLDDLEKSLQSRIEDIRDQLARI